MKKCMSLILTIVIFFGIVPVINSASAEGMKKSHSEDMWEYEIISDDQNTIALTHYKGEETDIYVPGTINFEGIDYTVTKLENNIFKNNQSVNSVTLADSIKEIGESAFEGAANLVCVVTTENLTTVNNNAFKNCISMNSIILYDAVRNIGTGVFDGCSNVTVYTNTGTIAYYYAENNNIPVSIIDIERNPVIVTENEIEYYIANGEAAVSDCPKNKTGEINIPAYINGVPVTKIGENAFSVSKISSVVFPNTLKNISDNAFWHCESLTDVQLPEGLQSIGEYAFQQCEALKTLEIPKNLKSIGDYAFSYCSSLSDIEIPNNITNLSVQMFSMCTGIKNITFHGAKTIESGCFNGVYYVDNVYFDNTEDFVKMKYNNYDSVPWVKNSMIKTYNFSGDPVNIYINGEIIKNITVPNGIKTINDLAFSCIFSLESIEMTDETESIGGSAFNYCNLKTVNIPSNVKEIGTNAFSNNVNLKSVTMSEGIKRIGSCAFGSCEALEKVKLPESLESFGTGAFIGCSSLSEINIPSGIKEIPTSLFCGCNSLTNLVLPDSIKKLGSDFIRNTGISELKIPDSVDDIDNTAFYDADVKLIIENNVYAYAYAKRNSIKYEAKSITESDINGITYAYSNKSAIVIKCNDNKSGAVIIPENVNNVPVKAIAENAFYSCRSISDITIPTGTEKIGRLAFGSCTSLKKVNLPEGIKEIGSSAFSYCSKLSEIDIPEGVESIEGDTFIYCSTLNSVKIPSTVKSTGNGAFGYCSNLRNVYISDLDAWCGIEHNLSGNPLANGASLILNGEPVTEIVFDKPEVKPYAFNNCKSIAKVTFTDNVKKIGEHSFQFCNKINTINIGNSVERIDDFAFASCGNSRKGLNVTFGKGIVSVGGSSFRNSYIKELGLKNTDIKTIGVNAFAGCGSLLNVELPENLEKIETGCFSGCTGLEAVLFNDNLKEISQGAFSGCRNLAKITLPVDLETIDSSAFRNTGIKEIIIPKSVSDMDDAFNSNTVLLVYIDSYALEKAIQNKWLYSVIKNPSNPEISYGTGISGTVSYNDGTPVINGSIDLLYDDGEVKESVTTDSNGAYSFTYAEVGKYTIRAADSNGNVGSELIRVKRKNVFDVFLSGTTDIKLKNSFTVFGSVNRDAAVTIMNHNGNIIKTVETSDKKFRFEEITNGEYIITAACENGSASIEITVFNGNVDLGEIVIAESSASVEGKVLIERNDFERHPRGWVQVTVYNSDGIISASGRTDEDGMYRFQGLSVGQYSIIATATEMCKDRRHGYKKSVELTGYAYINITENKKYTADTIILSEKEKPAISVSGKVTAQGENQACNVYLSDIFKNEIAHVKTSPNGKYHFKDVADGTYFILAVTTSNGMGYTVITIRDGVIYGNTNIFVYKSDKIIDHENVLNNIAIAADSDDIEAYRKKVIDEKKFYDGLSKKQKKEFSENYIDYLNLLIEMLTECRISATNGVTVKNAGMIVSGSELEDNSNIGIRVEVSEADACTLTESGITTDEEYCEQQIEDAAAGKELGQYYNIDLYKSVNGSEQQISDIAKDTDTTGNVTVTIPIPEENRGHKRYSLVHIHNGEVSTLVDVDDNPDTVTVALDKFSTFALMFDDVEDFEENSITYSYDGTKLNVMTNGTDKGKGEIWIGFYKNNILTEIQKVLLEEQDISCSGEYSNIKIFWWDMNTLKPYCEEKEIFEN